MFADYIYPFHKCYNLDRKLCYHVYLDREVISEREIAHGKMEQALKKRDVDCLFCWCSRVHDTVIEFRNKCNLIESHNVRSSQDWRISFKEIQFN